MADSNFVDREKQKQADNDIKDMISTLTKRLTSLQRVHKAASGDSGQNLQGDDEDDHGTRIITLAGTNVGASMRGEMDEKPGLEGVSPGENEALKTYVNSNFQSINNSIMLGGSYCTNDPGVHLDISDYVDQETPTPKGQGNKKERGSSKHYHHSQHSE
ncbi:uncharacterized protein [Nicotiana tomentosiformis]|uniref:uncharacterized protein n=1 Tax=Nicotiana tomentosiformis TaxID=4098 RepID=UPI00051C6210|nr:uncharacterized protein LOC104088274 [Nicotiana tomentosiformis]